MTGAVVDGRSLGQAEAGAEVHSYVTRATRPHDYTCTSVPIIFSSPSARLPSSGCAERGASAAALESEKMPARPGAVSQPLLLLRCQSPIAHSQQQQQQLQPLSILSRLTLHSTPQLNTVSSHNLPPLLSHPHACSARNPATASLAPCAVVGCGYPVFHFLLLSLSVVMVAAAGGARRRRAPAAAEGQSRPSGGAENAGMLRFYTDDAPGLKMYHTQHATTTLHEETAILHLPAASVADCAAAACCVV